MSAVLKEIPTSSPVTQFLATPKKMLINGKWVPAASGKTFEVTNPATGNVIARVAEGDKADIDAAVQAARRALESGPWATMTASERGKMIWRIGDLISKHRDELAELESLDNGKPMMVAKAADVPLAGHLPVHGRLVYQDRGQDDSAVGPLHARRAIPFLYAAGADWRRGADHSVEFSVADGRLETGTGACHGLHDRPEGRRGDSALGITLG